jgi:hypothetical protein
MPQLHWHWKKVMKLRFSDLTLEQRLFVLSLRQQQRRRPSSSFASQAPLIKSRFLGAPLDCPRHSKQQVERSTPCYRQTLPR